MKNILVGAAALGFLMTAGAVFAGSGGTTCANAEVLQAGTTYSGDTSGAGYGNPNNTFGPVPSPANDAIYKFVANNVSTSESITVNFGYDGFIALTGGCANNAQPYYGGQGGTGSQTLSLSLPAALVNGTTYYIIISGNPTADNTNNGEVGS